MAIFIAIVVIIIIFSAYKSWMEEKQKELQRQKLNFVKSQSACLQAIKNLNSNWSFIKFEAHQRFKRYCNSKPQLDNFNIDNHMLLQIEDSPNYFSNIVKATKFNKQKYPQYEQQYNNLLNNRRYDYARITANSILDEDEFKSIELSECQKIKLNPNRDFCIELIVCYTSPQGRNSYSKTYKFNCADIQHYLNEFSKVQQNKQSAVYQRQLMTPKMRYNIMKRDGFKCVICGRSQNDGAKLHVDHIKPVSKGGKTIESNLRTLCDMCNLGKSDSYDPNGIN